MSWTYDASLISESTTVGRRYIVRLTVGDTNTNDQQLQDEEIDYYVTKQSNNTLLASLDAARALLAKYSRETDLWIGHTRESRSDKVRNYKALIEYLDAAVASNTTYSVWFGGQSKAEKADRAADTDAVQPAFKVGSDDIDSGHSDYDPWGW